MNELAATANNKRKLAARLDAAILKLKDEAAAGIAACDTAIAEKSDQLRAWAEANPDQFAKDRKSITFAAGTLGFRTGTPKLELLSKRFNWKIVLANVQRLLPSFIRDKPEIDKEAIIAQRDEEAVQSAINACGMKVVQDEGFYVEPNLTDTEVQS